MSLLSKTFRTLAFALIVVSLASAALADTIRMKDGSRVKGKIVSFTGGKFIVAVGEGSRRRQMTFDAADIDSIQFDSPTVSSPMVAVTDRTVSTADKPKPVERPITNDDANRPEPAPTTSVPATVPSRKVSFGKPIELSVKVLGDNTANGWTNSGWVVKKGQRIRISGTGEISLGRGKTTSPSGLYDLEDTGKLLKSVPTGALIAVIGDDNNDFIYVGSEREFTATRDGALFLGVNEGNLNDNSGSFTVKVEISPDGGE
jgi:hypothetical protein